MGVNLYISWYFLPGSIMEICLPLFANEVYPRKDGGVFQFLLLHHQQQFLGFREQDMKPWHYDHMTCI